MLAKDIWKYVSNDEIETSLDTMLELKKRENWRLIFREEKPSFSSQFGLWLYPASIWTSFKNRLPLNQSRDIFFKHCTIWKLQWGSGHRIFSIFRRKQRFHIVDPIQLSPHDVFSHFSTSNLVTSSCIYPSSSWESESPWYLVTARVRKNEVKYLIFNIFQTKNAFLGY